VLTKLFHLVPFQVCPYCFYPPYIKGSVWEGDKTTCLSQDPCLFFLPLILLLDPGECSFPLIFHVSSPPLYQDCDVLPLTLFKLVLILGEKNPGCSTLYSERMFLGQTFTPHVQFHENFFLKAFFKSLDFPCPLYPSQFQPMPWKVWKTLGPISRSYLNAYPAPKF